MDYVKKRPLSPHLQIYKPQLTSVLSITHRATGIFLSLGALMLSLFLLSVAAGEQAFNNLQLHLAAWYGETFLVACLFSLYYHLCNGVRHLFWDAGIGLEIADTYKSGYAVIVVTLVLTITTLSIRFLS